jgi:hypothetical protein
MQSFSEKAPAEAVVLTFNFTLGLASGETLTGAPTVTVVNVFGTDTTAAALVVGTPSLDPTATQVLVPVAAGIDQNDYAVTVTCATSNALKTLTWSGLLPVRLYPSTTCN